MSFRTTVTNVQFPFVSSNAIQGKEGRNWIELGQDEHRSYKCDSKSGDFHHKVTKLRRVIYIYNIGYRSKETIG